MKPRPLLLSFQAAAGLALGASLLLGAAAGWTLTLGVVELFVIGSLVTFSSGMDAAIALLQFKTRALDNLLSKLKAGAPLTPAEARLYRRVTK